MVDTIKVLFLLLIISVTLGASQKNFDKFPLLRGPYLGQKSPGTIPKVFAPGIISHGFHELGISISPKGDEIFYITSDRQYQIYTIIMLQMVNDIWSAPRVAPFSGYYIDNSLCFSNDGRRLFFRSKRPLGGDTPGSDDGNIWVVEKISGEWSDPLSLKGPINTKRNEQALSVSAKGTIFFSARYEKEHGGDIYMSCQENGIYLKPEKIKGEVNTKYGEGRPFIAADESFLLFQSNRPGGLGQNDIWASFKLKYNRWSTPINLGRTINSSANEFAPYVSPDGKYFFFSSYKPLDFKTLKGKSYSELLEKFRSAPNGYATLFWVSARVIEDLIKKVPGQ